MPLVGASPVYRPPVAGEPLRLREDGHWSTRGLVGYWPMREMRGGMTQDVSPQGNHGTLVNGPTWGAGERGRGALSLTGNEGYIEAEALYYPVTGWSVVMRVRLNQPQPDWGYVWSQGYFTDEPNIYWKDNGTVMTFRDGERWRVTYNTPTVNDGKWHTMAAIYGGSYAEVWIDGASVGRTNVSPGSTGWAGHSLWQGTRRIEPGARYFDGDIETSMYYDRALSAAEIRALHAYPDLPIWRPRRGISLAGLAVPTGRPRPYTHMRHGPRLILGGII